MKTKRKILPMACCVAILSACASNQQVTEAPWKINPNIKSSMKANNTDPNATYKLGRYYQGQQRDDLAIAAYQKTIAAHPGFVEAYNGLGVIYARQGKYQQAVEAFKSALNYVPAAAHVYSNMGYAYYLQGQYTEAINALKQATTIDPSNHKALTNLGLAYAKSGSKGESFQALAQADKVESAQALPIENPTAKTDSSANSGGQQSASVTEIFTNRTPVNTYETAMNIQELALPKNVGIIRSAANSVPVVDSRVKLVQLAPNIYELHTQPNFHPIYDTPVQTAEEVPEAVNMALLSVEVSNGNGVTGMAAKVGKFLVKQGYSTARLTNQKPFNVKKSQIQYRDGHQAEAQILKDSLPESPELIQRSDMRADVAVRLVLGKDMNTHLAYFNTHKPKTQIALMVEEPKT